MSGRVSGCKRGEFGCPAEPGPRSLEAISRSLILICHSAALNTNRQIPADTRGQGDRKQLRVFCYENLQTIPSVENKNLWSLACRFAPREVFRR